MNSRDYENRLRDRIARDYARRDREMRRDSARRDRQSRDNARGGQNRDMADYRRGDRQRYDRNSSQGGQRQDNAMRDRGYQRDRNYRNIDMGFDMRSYDYDDDDYEEEDFEMYDYAGGNYLTDKELMHWSKKLLQEVDEPKKDFFTIDNIEKKAKDMSIKFEDFTFSEFYVVVLMMYTDYHKTLGTSNMDIYLALAKDWLCDEDVGMKYSEKLTAYYDKIVKG